MINLKTYAMNTWQIHINIKNLYACNLNKTAGPQIYGLIWVILIQEKRSHLTATREKCEH